MTTAAATINLTASDLARFASFRIPVELLTENGVRRVTDQEARNDCGIRWRGGDLSGVVFQIHGANGDVRGYRVRRDNPEMEGGKPKARYVQSVDRHALYFERSSLRWLSDLSVPVVLVEAYTSALALAALSERTGRPFLPVGTGGCWAWRGTIGRTPNENGTRVDEKGPSPDFDHIALQDRKVIVCLDANVATNPAVQAAERALKFELLKRGARPHLARVPDEPGVNGPDDYLAAHDDAAVLRMLESAAFEAWPEPKQIRAALRPVPALPPALIPDAFRDWLTDSAERMGCPIEFPTVAALVVTGAVIGAGCRIYPKRHDDWTVVPNLWGGVVGRPSLMKTPALQEAMRPLDRLAAEAREDFQAASKEHEADLEMFRARRDAAKDRMRAAAKGRKKDGEFIDELEARNEYAGLVEPPAPSQKRYKTNDATVEKLGELLEQNPRGILTFRDELVGQLSTWDREGREADRAFFLEAWNGTGSHQTDRIGRGSIHIENACVSLLGGIQPSKLLSYLYGAMRGHDNDGLVQRLQVLVYPDEPAATAIVDREPDRKAGSRVSDVIRRLAAMDFTDYGAEISQDGGSPRFRFSPEAQEAFYLWFDDLSRKLREDDEPVVTEHLGKYRSLMPSLALIFHLIDLADGVRPGPVSETATRRAMAWCDFLESHARRIYGMVTEIRVEAAARLAKRVRAGDLGDRFTLRDVYRRQWALLTDRDICEAAAAHLVDMSWLVRPGESSGAGGRPRSPEYLVNPRVSSVSSVSAPLPRLEAENDAVA